MSNHPHSVDTQPSAVAVGDSRENEFRTCAESVRSYQTLSDNWDRYGGVAAHRAAIEFVLDLLDRVRQATDIPAPLVRPISGGVYLEWRLDDRLLYFEVDEESVLCYSRNALGEKTVEDPGFDSAKAYETVVDFHQNAA